jgi:hypothetical protein
MKVGQCVGIGRDIGEPIVEDDMKLGGDIASVRIEDEWNGACMIGRDNNFNLLFSYSKL